MIKKIFYCISDHDRLLTGFILFIIIVGSGMELLGVSSFMPFLELLTEPESIETNALLRMCYSLLPFGNSTNFLACVALAIILVYICKNAFLVWQKNYIYKYSYNIQKGISEKLLSAYMHEPYTFFLNINIAELQRTLTIDTDYFAKAIIHGLETMSELFVCVTLGVYLFTVSWSISIMVIIILCLFVVFFVWVSRRITRTESKRMQGYNARIYQDINQSLGGIKEIKVLGREQNFVDDYVGILKKYIRTLRIVRLLGIVPKYIVEAGSMTGLLLALILKMYFGQGDFQEFVPQLGVFAVAAFRLMPSVGRISEHYNAVLASLPSVDVIYRDIKDVDDRGLQEETAADTTWKMQNAIHVRNVTYAYPNTDVNVVENVSFDIIKGKTVAFIGASGAGKSTMVDIILGLLIPQKGFIAADDLNVTQNLRTWHKEIGYIPQTIYLSDDTIRNNIAFGVARGEVDEDAVRRAADQAQLTEFLDSLPEGLDTMVGDRGVRLSGGQRQRIGIARALYHDPEVLVLDEATSALDNDTETAVMQAIDSLHGSKTIIVIAHRLTTIRNADQIYEVGDGKVVAREKAEVLK